MSCKRRAGPSGATRRSTGAFASGRRPGTASKIGPEVNAFLSLRDDALEFHSTGRKGKIEVVPSKPCATARDLSLAYSPGVAEPCLEIQRDNELAYEYTAKGNLVGVVTNGTAVLGLG